MKSRFIRFGIPARQRHGRVERKKAARRKNDSIIIIKIVSALLATLGAWVLAKVKSLINTKIKNEKARNLLQGATNVVSNAVKATYQTYVESIKGTDAWTKDAQEEALKLAIAAARMQLSADVEKFINDNFGDVETWIKSQIEATLYDLKNKPLEVQNENG